MLTSPQIPLELFANLLEGRKAQASEFFESFDPFTGKPWALVPRCREAEVDAAVTAASGLSWIRRGVAFPRAHGARCSPSSQISSQRTLIGWQEFWRQRDNGKLLAEMTTQLRYIPQWFRYFGGLADKLEGAVLPIDKPSMFTYTRREPLGVIAAITPWNSPLLLLVWKLAPLLAAGNTVVIKPSEHASCSTLAFVELFAEAGFPPGVVNTITGFAPEAGEPLVRHPQIAKIAFTGGEPGGLSVYRAAAEQLKHVTLELGGKSANIVFADANL